MLLLAACQPAVTPVVSDSGATQAALEEAAANLRRWNSTGMFDSVATLLLTEDHHSMPPNHPPISGRSDWLAWVKSLVGQVTVTDELVPGTRHYTFADSLVIETGGFVHRFVPASNAPPTIQAFSDTGKYMWQWRRTSSGWRIAAAIWNSNLTPRP
jgi:hypothetical protein